MSEKKNMPLEVLRDGNLKCSIWKNTYGERTIHSVQFRRTYQDKDGNYRDTDSFSKQDLLRLSRLAGQSYDALNRLREEARDRTNKPRSRNRDRGHER